MAARDHLIAVEAPAAIAARPSRRDGPRAVPVIPSADSAAAAAEAALAAETSVASAAAAAGAVSAEAAASAAAAAVASVEAAAAVLADAAVAALAVGAEKFQSHLTGQKARRFEPTCFFCLRELTKKRRSKAFFAPAWCR